MPRHKRACARSLRRDARPVQNALVDLNGSLDLTFLAEQIPENQINLDSLRVLPGGEGELGNSAIDLARCEKVETQNIVNRSRSAPPPLGWVRPELSRPDTSDRDAGDECHEDHEDHEERLLPDIYQGPSVLPGSALSGSAPDRSTSDKGSFRRSAISFSSFSIFLR